MSIMRSYEHPAPTTTEVIYPADIDLLTLESVIALRTAQEDFISQARRDSIAGLDDIDDISRASREAEAVAFSNLDPFTRELMLTKIPEDDEKFDEYFSVLRAFSIDSMADEKFFEGDKDDDGNYIPETKGWNELRLYRNQQLIERGIPIEDVDDDDDADDTEILNTAEYDAAINNLNLARAALAEAEVQFRTQKWFNGPKKRAELKRLRDLYEEAS